MTKLYEITDELKELDAIVESGELSESDIEDTLEALVGEFSAKAVNVAKYIKNLSSDVTQIKAERDRLKKMLDAKARCSEGLKDYLRHNMAAAGVAKVDHPIAPITLKKAGSVLVVDDDSIIPVAYKKLIPPRYDLDKKMLLCAIKGGMEVEGAHLEQGKQPLQIG